MKKMLIRVALFVVAIVLGGFLGVYLLEGFDTLKMIFFILICIGAGYVFNYIDKKIG